MTIVTENESFLLTRNLAIGYKHKPALLKDLNLSLPPRRLTCFMGPNGVGKSTLIRTLAGLQPPLSGDIIYKNTDGTSIAYNDTTQMPKKVSVVLTDRINSANLTVYDLVAYGRYPYLPWNLKLSDSDKDAVTKSITKLHIDHLRNRKIYELSDGQLQMAMIARALAQDGDIILLDEPTAHLDLNNRVEIMSLLRRIARESGKAILVSTHELDLALQTADLIWLAGKDENILTGIPEDLVLDGSFDTIFKLKGFNLKTGKVLHEFYQKLSVNLIGEGHEYLWTRNALERNGYRIATHDYGCDIKIISSERELKWEVHLQGETFVAASLRELLHHLQLPK